MPTLFETIRNGAMYSFAPLILLLAVDLVCLSLPVMLSRSSDGIFSWHGGHLKKCLSREPELKSVQR